MAEFPPGEWGTFGQWASALITGAAFTATFYVIRRDAKVRRFAQARKSAFFIKEVPLPPIRRDGPLPHNLFFKNLSDEPLYEVTFYRLEHRRRVSILGECPALLPEGTCKSAHTGTPTVRDTHVEFRDNSGITWVRRLDGRHYEITRLYRRFLNLKVRAAHKGAATAQLQTEGA
jgi:hypothetical protein